MNRFKDTLDELRRRPGAKQLEEVILPDIQNPAAPRAPEEGNGSFKLPYSSDPEPVVEPWK